MSRRHSLAILSVSAVLSAAVASLSQAAITVHAFYRLGDDDPGATAGTVGNETTQDSTAHDLDLNRRGVPMYSDDVPSKTRLPDTLSMAFNNNPALVGPGPLPDAGYVAPVPFTFPGGRWGVEAWVKPASADYVGKTDYALIAYNGNLTGDPLTANGIGLFQKGSRFVVRIGTHEKVLGPVVPGKWTHLAFVRSPLGNRFFMDGAEEADNSVDAQFAPTFPIAGGGGFIAIGTVPPAATAAAAVTDSFWGLIDEVRFFSFAPPIVVGGAETFDAAADLLFVPEPGTVALSVGAFGLMLRRRR